MTGQAERVKASTTVNRDPTPSNGIENRGEAEGKQGLKKRLGVKEWKRWRGQENKKGWKLQKDGEGCRKNKFQVTQKGAGLIKYKLQNCKLRLNV